MATQAWPVESFVQVKPSSHGGFLATCGLPPYITLTLALPAGNSFASINGNQVVFMVKSSFLPFTKTALIVQNPTGQK
jgi:hypothetical protein